MLCITLVLCTMSASSARGSSPGPQVPKIGLPLLQDGGGLYSPPPELRTDLRAAANEGLFSHRGSSIPGGGIPGEDYPVLASVPDTGFSCSDQDFPGYFADDAPEAGCQVFYICQFDGRQDSFLCPNGTIFNQQYFICDWWFNVDCSSSEMLARFNDNFGRADINRISSDMIDYNEAHDEDKSKYSEGQGSSSVTSPPQQYGVPTDSSQEYGLPTEPSKQYGEPVPPAENYGPPTTTAQQIDIPATPSIQYRTPESLSQSYESPSEIGGGPQSQPLNIPLRYDVPQGVNQIPSMFYDLPKL